MVSSSTIVGEKESAEPPLTGRLSEISGMSMARRKCLRCVRALSPGDQFLKETRQDRRP